MVYRKLEELQTPDMLSNFDGLLDWKGLTYTSCSPKGMGYNWKLCLMVRQMGNKPPGFNFSTRSYSSGFNTFGHDKISALKIM